MTRVLVAVGVIATVAMCSPVGAEYPARPVRLIVPFAPGGANDSVARLLADKLGKVLGRPVVVENKSGGGTIVGTAFVAASPPDGYTLLLVSPAYTINPHINKTLPFNPLTDFTPVAQVTRSAMIVLPLRPTTISDVQAGDYPYTLRSECIAQTWKLCALEQRSPGAMVRCPRIDLRNASIAH